MLYTDYTQKLLNLQDVLVTKVTSSKYLTVVDIEMSVSPHICPACNHSTSYIHDYRRQLIRDIPAFGSNVVLNYRRRRYRCHNCGKCFSERHPFVPRYHRMTSRLLFKRSRRLLIKRQSKLRDWEKEQVNSLLYVSDELRFAYYLKEQFYEMIDAEDREKAKRLMSDWIMSAQSSGIEEYAKCAKTLINWQTGILNSFDVPCSNGFTEGCNNRIKVLKRNAYGYRNFNRFRNRILHMFSYKNDLAKQGH